MPHVSQDAFLDHVGVSRNGSFQVALQTSDRVHGALFCDLDPDHGQTQVKFSGDPGQICTIETSVEGVPHWVVLRLELGRAAFLPGDVLGLVVKGAMDRPFPVQVYLRMVREGGLADTRFKDEIMLGTGNGCVTCLHTLLPDDPACGAEGQCALVLGLPRETARITVEALGFFVLPAAEGLRSRPIRRVPWQSSENPARRDGHQSYEQVDPVCGNGKRAPIRASPGSDWTTSCCIAAIAGQRGLPLGCSGAAFQHRN